MGLLLLWLLLLSVRVGVSSWLGGIRIRKLLLFGMLLLLRMLLLHGMLLLSRSHVRLRMWIRSSRIILRLRGLVLLWLLSGSRKSRRCVICDSWNRDKVNSTSQILASLSVILRPGLDIRVWVGASRIVDELLYTRSLRLGGACTTISCLSGQWIRLCWLRLLLDMRLSLSLRLSLGLWLRLRMLLRLGLIV